MAKSKATTDVTTGGADKGLDQPSAAPGEAISFEQPGVTEQAMTAPYQELMTSWWTTAALAWGTPVRMWSEIVAAAWRPFLPPTALTTDPRETLPVDRPTRAEAPAPAQPAPQAARRAPRVDAPTRSVPGTKPRAR
ncbi:MAG: hypothetical protein U1E42_06520 [Rhodospirillales bacterium]